MRPYLCSGGQSPIGSNRGCLRLKISFRAPLHWHLLAILSWLWNRRNDMDLSSASTLFLYTTCKYSCHHITHWFLLHCHFMCFKISSAKFKSIVESTPLKCSITAVQTVNVAITRIKFCSFTLSKCHFHTFSLFD